MLILSADPWLYDTSKLFSTSTNKSFWLLTFISRLETCFPSTVKASAKLNLWGRTASKANGISCRRTSWSRCTRLLGISWDGVGHSGRSGIGNWYRHSNSRWLNECMLSIGLMEKYDAEIAYIASNCRHHSSNGSFCRCWFISVDSARTTMLYLGQMLEVSLDLRT